MTTSAPAFRLAQFYFWYFGFLGAFAPFWSLYLKAEGLSAAQIAILLATIPVTRVVGPTFWGWVADTRGARMPVVRFTTVATLIVYLGVFAGSGFWWLFAVMFVLNLFWSGSLPLAEATTMGHLGDQPHRYGRIRVWGSVGFVAAVAIAGQILDITGIHALVWIVVALLAAHAISAWKIPEAPVRPHANDAMPIGALLRRPPVIALFAGCLLMSVANGPYNTFYSIWLVDHGYGKGPVGLLWALSVVAEIFVFVGWARLSQRFPLRNLLLTAYAVTVGRYLVIAWLPDLLVPIIVAQLAHAATFALFHAAAVAFTHRFFAGRHQSRGQALYSGIGFGAGGVLGSLLAGSLWDTIGGAWTLTCGSVAALAAFLVTARALKEELPAPTSDDRPLVT